MIWWFSIVTVLTGATHLIHVFLQWMFEPCCQGEKHVNLLYHWQLLRDASSVKMPPRGRDLKPTGPVKHLWLQSFSECGNLNHPAANCLLLVIILFICLVQAAGEWSRTLVKQQTMLALFSVFTAADPFWERPCEIRHSWENISGHPLPHPCTPQTSPP